MIHSFIALYSWTNGVVMIGIFALVCMTLIGILANFMTSGTKKGDSKTLTKDNSPA